MITLLLLAGQSQRFRQAGYAAPKPLLPMPDGRTMLDWSLDSLKPETLVTVARREEMKALSSVILGYMNEHNDCGWRATWLEEPTNGPLDSAARARKWLHTESELLIAYCDVLLLNGHVQRFVEYCRASRKPTGCVVFPSEDERFGYWERGLAISGLFYFANANVFAKRARHPQPETSILVTFRRSDTCLYHADDSHLLDLGTPDDYRRFLAGSRAWITEF